MTQTVAVAHPNIALIKYWGKRDLEANLPAVDSLSVTLESLHTRMALGFDEQLQKDSLTVNGVDSPNMLARVSKCLDDVCGAGRARAVVAGDSNFPIGAGLASSASAFAALVVAANAATGGKRNTAELARLAGRASGSAARSLYGGIVSLNVDESDIDVRQICEPSDWPLEVIVAVTEEGQKVVGSSEAMIRSATTSPFYGSWLEEQGADFTTALDAIHARDFARLAAVAEHNCLKMHSVMWTSKPPVVYWNDATLACMETVRALQADGHAVFFTIDAGPQVKAICLPDAAAVVADRLQQTPGVVRILRSVLGQGAQVVTAE